jgi:hypothetical protein
MLRLRVLYATCCLNDDAACLRSDAAHDEDADGAGEKHHRVRRARESTRHLDCSGMGDGGALVGLSPVGAREQLPGGSEWVGGGCLAR